MPLDIARLFSKLGGDICKFINAKYRIQLLQFLGLAPWLKCSSEPPWGVKENRRIADRLRLKTYSSDFDSTTAIWKNAGLDIGDVTGCPEARDRFCFFNRLGWRDRTDKTVRINVCHRWTSTSVWIANGRILQCPNSISARNLLVSNTKRF